MDSRTWLRVWEFDIWATDWMICLRLSGLAGMVHHKLARRPTISRLYRRVRFYVSTQQFSLNYSQFEGDILSAAVGKKMSYSGVWWPSLAWPGLTWFGVSQKKERERERKKAKLLWGSRLWRIESENFFLLKRWGVERKISPGQNAEPHSCKETLGGRYRLTIA